MARKKGTLEQIVETVGEAVQTIAVELTGTPEDVKPQTKAARKASHKAAVAEVERAKREAVKVRLAARLRAGA